MLCETIKKARKERGLSQEELAGRLNVVRQTVSKWEKGLSVPDAEMLVRLAEALDTSVETLLGERPRLLSEENRQVGELAAQLQALQEENACFRERRRKRWRVLFLVLASAVCLVLLRQLAEALYSQAAMDAVLENSGAIGGYDGPTGIYVSRIPWRAASSVLALAGGAAALVGLYQTRKR